MTECITLQTNLVNMDEKDRYKLDKFNILFKRCRALLKLFDSIKPEFIKVKTISRTDVESSYPYHFHYSEETSGLDILKYSDQKSTFAFFDELGRISEIGVHDKIDTLDLTKFDCADKVYVYLFEGNIKNLVKNEDTSVHIVRGEKDEEYNELLRNIEVERAETRFQTGNQLGITYPDVDQYEIVNLNKVKRFYKGKTTDKHLNDCKDNLYKLIISEDNWSLSGECSAEVLEVDMDALNKDKLTELSKQLPNLSKFAINHRRINIDGLKLSELPDVGNYKLNLPKDGFTVDKPLEVLHLKYYIGDIIDVVETETLVEALSSVNFEYFPTKILKLGNLVIELSDTRLGTKSARK